MNVLDRVIQELSLKSMRTFRFHFVHLTQIIDNVVNSKVLHKHCVKSPNLKWWMIFSPFKKSFAT